MLQAVKVRLRKPARVFVFLARDLALSRGDSCVVRTERGLEYGTCIVEPDDCADDMAKRYPMSVVRKTSNPDQNTFRQIAEEEERGRVLCNRKIQERNLPMNLVDVEYTFDRHKATFYFTADDRVDFRDLVRDLAHDLKARIELRHIQVRDKAKIVGGFAACGRELCCATWMGEFMPISMKMAKRQNLSLNPAKISGQCGRLMCCLSYENDQYGARKKGAAVCDTEGAEKETAGPEWEAAAEDESALAEEGELRDDETLGEEGATAPGEAVIVVDANGAEQPIDEEEEPEGAPESEAPDKDQKPRHHSRRRRKRRKSSSGDRGASGSSDA